MNEPHLHKLALIYRDSEYEVIAEQTGRGAYRLQIHDHSVIASGTLEGDELSADIDGFRQRLVVAEHDGIWSAYRHNGAFSFRVRSSELGGEEFAAGLGNPRAPMNGVVVALLAEVGEAVEAEAPLLVMEAMKMEHTIRAPAAGCVTEYYFQPGELVDGDAELLNFAAEQ